MTASAPSQRQALFFALGAHAAWGSMPLYLLLVKAVPLFEFVAWRTLCTLPVCLVALAWKRSWGEIAQVLANRQALRSLLGSAALIAVNWCLYVWAINSGHIYAASLGYYILPLVMMLLGLVFLNERLNRLQWCAVLLATLCVGALALGALSTLWVSLACALTFGLYGLLRKTVAAGPVAGLAIESLLLAPVAGGFLLWSALSGPGLVLGRATGETIATLLSGVMTAVPLILFATAARAMRYTTIGFLQFLSPTVVFVIGLVFFKEPLNPAQLACFVAIWAAAGVFVWDMLRGRRAAVQAGAAPPAV